MAVGKNEISVYAMTKGKKQTNATKAAGYGKCKCFCEK